MSNLTIAIDDEVLRRARVRAVSAGTSVNAVLRDYLEGYSKEAAATTAMQELLRIASDPASRVPMAGPPATGRQWSRDTAYEGRAAPSRG